MKKALLKTAGLATLLTLVALSCPGLLGPEFRRALSGTDLRYVVGAAALGLGLIQTFRTLRIRDLLLKASPSHVAPHISTLFAITLKTRTLNIFLPAKTGETYRIFSVHRISGHPKKMVLLSVLRESVVEVLSFGLILAFLIPGFPRMGLVAVTFALLIVVLRMRLAVAMFYTLCSDLVDALMIGACLHAVGIEFAPIQWLMVLVGINLAILIPSPANLGTLEAGAVLVLMKLGADQSSALAFALLYRAAHVAPLVLGYAVLQMRPNFHLFRVNFRPAFTKFINRGTSQPPV